MPRHGHDPRFIEPWFIRRQVAKMRVTDYVLHCVCFIGIKTDGLFQPRGTCFFVRIDQRTLAFHYIVTARHNVASAQSKGDQLWLRVNKSGDAPAKDLLIPDSGWVYHPDQDRAHDVAITGITIEADDEIRVVSLTDEPLISATSQRMLDVGIGVGDEIAVIGLFRNHFGMDRNLPIVRIGSISAVKSEPIKTRLGFLDAHLVELHSIGGLSGSPVFINTPPFRIDSDNRSQFWSGNRYYLLGMMHGHFDISNLSEDTVVEDAGLSSRSSINAGIGLVIPVEEILETLEQPALFSFREAFADRYFEASTVVPDGPQLLESGPPPKS